MTKPKFTPGPWSKTDGQSYEVVYDKNGQAIFHLLYPFLVYDLALIMKAPEMYCLLQDALYLLMSVYDSGDPLADSVDRYINKVQELLKGINEEKL